MNIVKLKAQVTQLRLDVIKMIGPDKKGHFGGSMSSADIITALYFEVMELQPKNPKWSKRDRFILSKGHSCPALYAALARKGYFSIEQLNDFKNIGSMLQGHPDRTKTPGIEVNTGSLGQGLSQGNGMAMALKMDGNPSHVFVIIGDGELNEGQVWEAAMFTAAKELDNITVIIDKNNLQAMGKTSERLDSGNINEKFKAFGFRTIEIDGHNMEEIVFALKDARNDAIPTCIIANTIKGKGIQIAENNPSFHNGVLNKEQYEKAIADLEAQV